MKLSKYISYFFHPINFSIIGAVLYFIFVPKYIFKPQEYLFLIIIFIGTYIVPLILTVLMKLSGLISNYTMPTIDERKFPLLVFIAISLFIGNWLMQSTAIDLLALSYYGYGTGLIAIYILLHLNKKISLHTCGIGGLIGFLIFFSYYYKTDVLSLLILLFILSGMIGSARLNLKAHTLKEVLLGFIIGLFSQLAVYSIYIYNI